MRKMWLRLEVVVAGLPPLDMQYLISFLVDFSLQFGQDAPVPFNHFSIQINPKKCPHLRDAILK